MTKQDFESICSKKIIEGSVRMTIYKVARLGEYLQAALMPQFNMPMGSKMDYDTLSPLVTSHIIKKRNYGTLYTY